MTQNHSGILSAAVAAHGGQARWSRVQALRVRVRGLFPLLMTKGVAPTWRKYSALIDACRPHARFAHYPHADWQGEFDHWRVRIQAPDGATTERDYAPTPGSARPRWRWLWDDLDMLFFLGYAMWNYKITPFWFTRPEFRCLELPPMKWRGRWLHRLDVVYPPDLPKHTARQRFYFNDQALLTRLDYRADVIGQWARGAHLCGDHRDFGGLIYPAHRAVYGGWFPRLIPRFPPAVIARFDEITPVCVSTDFPQREQQ